VAQVAVIYEKGGNAGVGAKLEGVPSEQVTDTVDVMMLGGVNVEQVIMLTGLSTVAVVGVVTEAAEGQVIFMLGEVVDPDGKHAVFTVRPVTVEVATPEVQVDTGVRTIVGAIEGAKVAGWINCAFSPIVDRSIIQSDGWIRTGMFTRAIGLDCEILGG
jgi:hypothetical protein